ncbi:MAG: hypothetical protein ACI89L_000015 [Phycisphaerales bacterium]|jgi:hypothetical protein
MLTRSGLRVVGGGRVSTLVVLGAMASMASAQPVVYVDDDATPGGSGASWASAYTHLQDALAAAAGSAGAITEIRVAGGVYTPDTTAANPAGTGSRLDTFNLVKNVTVAGGYAGSLAVNGDDRDTIANETVLSGEIGAAGATDNSYHVTRAFSVGGPVFLDGLTIADGNANYLSSSDNRRGGGLYLLLGDATITDCTFTNNYGVDGGAIHANMSTLAVHGSSFDGNSAKYGGGVYQISTGVTITGTAFTGNTASSTGGAFRRTGGTGITVSISDCVFDGNSAQQGGAIDLFANFPGVSIERTVFSYNVANTISGAISNFSEGMTAESCLFVGNSSGNLAGAIGANFNNSGQPGPNLINCTVVGNSAAAGGGVYSLGGAGAINVVNSILWGNSDNGGADETAQIDLTAIANLATTSVDSSVVMGLAPGGLYDSGTNTGNSGTDPMFVDESMDDYHLSIASSAIDTGDNTAVIGALDLDGLARVVDGDFDTTPTVDRGAYEFVSSDSDGDGLDDNIEITIGTDPFNPDSDADGLLDGTEYDMAMGGGCPDPLAADSDGDGLNDGEEVLLSTNPCLADTDADGVNDFNDPTPTVPGVTQEFLEEAARDISDAIDMVTLASFTGPNNNANSGRQNSLSTRLLHAANMIADGDIDGALNQLGNVLERTDGVSKPKDWIAPGPEQEALKTQIELIIALLLL